MALKIIETNFSFGGLTTRSKTTRLVMHHVAGNMTAAAIHALHKNTNGWAGIGYHFVVDKDGTVYRGRPIGSVGAHATGYNSDSVGICFNGNFESETMTAVQKAAGQELVSYIMGLYPSIITIQRHSDVQATACPGKNFPFSEIKAGASGSSGGTSTATGSYTVKAGDTMSSIAKSHGISLAELTALNPAIKDINKISIGQKITVSGATASYMVKVTASELNIRSGAGTNYSVVGSIKDWGAYTIVEEKNGWGKLKSGAGWISLSYTQKV